MLSRERLVLASAAVWIRGREIQKERLLTLVFKNWLTNFRHLDRVPGISLQVLIKMENRFGSHVKFTNLHRAITSLRHQLRKREGPHCWKRLKLMKVMSVAILPIKVVM